MDFATGLFPELMSKVLHRHLQQHQDYKRVFACQVAAVPQIVPMQAGVGQKDGSAVGKHRPSGLAASGHNNVMDTDHSKNTNANNYQWNE